MTETSDELQPHPPISLLLSDVDGTLVTKAKQLTPATIAAVHQLRDHGIAFAVTSSRPPRGLKPLIETLEISTPIAGFNSGMIVDRTQRVLRTQALDAEVTARLIPMLDARGVDIWFFSGNDWLVRDRYGVYVAHEEMTIGYGPLVIEDFAPAYGTGTKIVGVSEDFSLLAHCEQELRQALGPAASVARSQNYYLDITHPDANKGSAVLALAELLNVPTAHIATIGDMANDVPMFDKSGFSIAMGNADSAVKARARATTDTNENDGFAKAVERFVLPRAR